MTWIMHEGSWILSNQANGQRPSQSDGLLTAGDGDDGNALLQTAKNQVEEATMLAQLRQALFAPSRSTSNLGSFGAARSDVCEANPGSVRELSGSTGNVAEDLAQDAERVARNMGSTGLCYRGVKRALRANGVNVEGGSAYQAASQLARSRRFVEVPPDQVRRGDVLVHGRSARKEHGHIAVALGNGREASDHIQTLIRGRGYGGTRVFRPVDNTATA